jgi:hypothetical protein
MTVLAVIIVALAAYRITRLIVTDAILDAPRNWLFTHSPTKIAELLDCPHCVGVWVGGVAAVFYLVARVVTVWLALPFAFAAVVSLVAALDGR